eukprot:m.260827 g.260827  ORF g.260827 m.260827 type:complete len:87 (-) comp26779_c0_seq42:279-539(-)
MTMMMSFLTRYVSILLLVTTRILTTSKCLPLAACTTPPQLWLDKEAEGRTREGNKQESSVSEHAPDSTTDRPKLGCSWFVVIVLLL